MIMEKDLHINSIDDLIKLAESERLSPSIHPLKNGLFKYEGNSTVLN
jgi:hypothetical protein